MTIYEHAMLGINGALAAGLHRRHGWQIVALAGAAAVLPDVDGLTILFGLRCYSEGHRLWGHNLLVAGLAAAVLSIAAYQTDVFGRVRRWLAARWPIFAVAEESLPRGRSEVWLWTAVGVAAAWSHLLIDVLFSIGKDLPVWGVSLGWPFSDVVWAYPLVRWGDVGVTVIFAASMFAMVRWPARIRLIAAGSLVAAAFYIAVRGL